MVNDSSRINRSSSRRLTRLLSLMGAVLVLLAVFVLAGGLWGEAASARKTQEVLDRIQAVTPAVAGGVAEDSSPNFSYFDIDGVSYVGVLSIPSLGVDLPVRARMSEGDSSVAPYLQSESFAEGLVVVGSNARTQLGNLRTLRSGEALLFTDIDGNTYAYRMKSLFTCESLDFADYAAQGADIVLVTRDSSTDAYLVVLGSQGVAGEST